MTYKAGAAVCCSAFEGEFPTAASATKQLVMSRRHLEKLSAEREEHALELELPETW
jgi:hypothetical protein